MNVFINQVYEMVMRFFYTLVLCLTLVGCGDIPSSYIPWGEIDLKDEAGPFSDNKMDGFQGNFEQCKAALTKADIQFTPVEDKTNQSCPLTEQITLNKSLYPYSAPVTGQCSIIAALVNWERAVVQKQALKIFGTDVKRITHYGMYSCRNIRGSSRRSEHSTANAIDIAAFTLKDGTKISVLNDWDDRGKKGQFLRAVFKGGCKVFVGALGPNYNKAHANHFHFDMGPWNMCD